MGIPTEEYIKIDGNKYITLGLMEIYHTDEQMKDFNQWFFGQTGPILPSGTLGIYPWDYERWLQTAQGADWD